MKKILALLVMCMFFSGCASAQDELGDGEFTGNTKPDGVLINAATNSSINCTGRPYYPTGVAYFDTAWNGYKYWMCINGSRPNIVASNNGDDWEVPSGMNSTYFDTPYGAEPWLFYDNTSDELWLFGNLGQNLSVRNSTDGITWGPDYVSYAPLDPYNITFFPTITKNETTYFLYSYRSYPTGHLAPWNITVATSTDGKNWSNPTICQFDQDMSNFIHNKYYTKPSFSYYESLHRMFVHVGLAEYEYKIFSGKSTDGINWNMSLSTPVLAGNPPYWDQTIRYGTVIFHNNLIDLFYSATGYNPNNENPDALLTGHTTMDYEAFNSSLTYP